MDLSLTLFSLDLSSLEQPHSLPTSLVRIKEDSIFESFYETKATRAQARAWTERTLLLQCEEGAPCC